MKILFVLENYFPNVGGVETLFKALLEKLADNGHQVTLITTLLDKNSPEFEERGNLKIYRYPYKNRYRFTFFAFLPVIKHSKDCDLIHTTSYNAGLPAWLGSLIHRKKVVITFHEVWGKLWFKLPYFPFSMALSHFMFEQMLLKLPYERFIAVSNATKKNLQDYGVKEKKISRIYNGLDYKWIEGLKKNHPGSKHKKFTVTYYGRLGISKGLNLIIEAADILKSKFADRFHFKLVLPRHPRNIFDRIMHEMEMKKLDDFISLYHNLETDELVHELKSSNAIMIPSYSEGFCFAAAESIALDLPVISSGRAALKEVVSGKFITMENQDGESLVNAILEAEKGNWEEKPIRYFKLEDTIKAYLELYREILPEKSKL